MQLVADATRLNVFDLTQGDVLFQNAVANSSVKVVVRTMTFAAGAFAVGFSATNECRVNGTIHALRRLRETILRFFHKRPRGVVTSTQQESFFFGAESPRVVMESENPKLRRGHPDSS